MIDKIYVYRKTNLLDQIDVYNQEAFYYKELCFNREVDRFGKFKFYSAFDRLGLRHCITTEEYRIQNSFHKAYNKINGDYGNYNDFNFTSFKKLVNYLSIIYDMPLSETFIRKMEFGVNVILENKPMNYISKLNSSKFTKEPQNMLAGYQVYGKKIFLSTYNLKLYDKSFETYSNQRLRVNQNILRFEIEIKKRQFINKYVNTLEDLLDREKYESLESLLLSKFYELKFNGNHNVKNLSTRQLELYHAGSVVKYWKDISLINKNTAATKRQTYNKIQNMLNSDMVNGDKNIIEIRRKVRDKIFSLL